MKICVVHKVMRADLQCTEAALYNLRVCTVYIGRCVDVGARAVQGLLR